MKYQLYLTDSCNRKCSFCWVKNTNFFESIQNLDFFCQEVKKNILKNRSSNVINFFGGEPLLNFKGLDYVIQTLKDHKFTFNLFSNGDMIECIKDYKYSNLLNVQITAYDIFNDALKYKKIIQKFRHIFSRLTLAYTFTQTDINRIEDFLNICADFNINSKISISHDPDSWNLISEQELYNVLYEFYKKEFNKIYISKNNQIHIPNTIEKYLKRSISLIFDKNIKEFLCIDDNQNVFYNGKFVGPCLRFKDMKIDIDNEMTKKCIECQYKKACTKSCLAEHIGNEYVIEKLCITEKAPFDVIFNLIKNNIEVYKYQKILKILLQDMYISE